MILQVIYRSAIFLIILALAPTLCGAPPLIEPTGRGTDQKERKALENNAKASFNRLYDEGMQAVARRDYEQAENSLKRAIKEAENLNDLDDTLNQTLNCLGSIYLTQERFTDAEAVFDRLLRNHQIGSVNNQLANAKTLEQLSLVHAKTDRIASATRLLRRALAIREHLQGRENEALIEPLNNLACLVMYQGMARAVESIATQADALSGKKAPTNPDPFEPCIEEAETLFRRLLGLQQRYWGNRVADSIDTLTRLIECCRLQEQPSKIEPLLWQLLQQREQMRGPDDLSVADALVDLGQFNIDCGNFVDAERLLSRAIRIRCENAKHNNSSDALSERQYCQKLLGKASRSKNVFKEQIQRPSKADLDFLRASECGMNNATLAALFRETSLNVQKINTSNELLSHVLHLINLEELMVSDGHDINDQGLFYLNNLVNIQTLELRGACICGSGLSNLAAMASLTNLGLSGCQLTDAGLASLPPLPCLRNLDISRTRVSDSGLRYLAKQPHLRELNIAKTSITERGVAILNISLPSLKIVW